jgi:transcriptional regulator with XRE-family HTH domain
VTDLTAHIGATLRWHRERAQLTQRQLAEAAGTTQATLANIERGSRPPSVDMLERLFVALGVQVRLRIEPLDVEVDAEIAAITKTRWPSV